jgi:hypothetical protein
VTIKQILDAQQAHPDAEFRIDGQEISQVDSSRHNRSNGSLLSLLLFVMSLHNLPTSHTALKMEPA